MQLPNAELWKAVGMQVHLRGDQLSVLRTWRTSLLTGCLLGPVILAVLYIHNVSPSLLRYSAGAILVLTIGIGLALRAKFFQWIRVFTESHENIRRWSAEHPWVRPLIRDVMPTGDVVQEELGRALRSTYVHVAFCVSCILVNAGFLIVCGQSDRESLVRAILLLTLFSHLVTTVTIRQLMRDAYKANRRVLASIYDKLPSTVDIVFETASGKQHVQNRQRRDHSLGASGTFGVLIMILISTVGPGSMGTWHFAAWATLSLLLNGSYAFWYYRRLRDGFMATSSSLNHPVSAMDAATTVCLRVEK